MPIRSEHIALLLLLATLGAISGCDAVGPSHQASLVVEAWFDTDAPLPPIRITSSQSVSQALQPVPAPELTHVQVTLRDQTIDYVRSLDDPLWFTPVEPASSLAVNGSPFELTVDAPGSSIVASGLMPPKIRLENVLVSVPDEPISVVLVDSLNVGLDSLNLAVNATTGFIYPVQVSVTWMDADFDGWVEARLQPDDSFSSSLIDFFLLPSEVFLESTASALENGRRRWQGVYAIPVSESNTPLPDHSLRVVLTRGDDRFARFITSRDSPERREPVSNVHGGLGFVGGVSSDSLRLDVHR